MSHEENSALRWQFFPDPDPQHCMATTNSESHLSSSYNPGPATTLHHLH